MKYIYYSKHTIVTAKMKILLRCRRCSNKTISLRLKAQTSPTLTKRILSQQSNRRIQVALPYPSRSYKPSSCSTFKPRESSSSKLSGVEAPRKRLVSSQDPPAISVGDVARFRFPVDFLTAIVAEESGREVATDVFAAASDVFAAAASDEFAAASFDEFAAAAAAFDEFAAAAAAAGVSSDFISTSPCPVVVVADAAI